MTDQPTGSEDQPEQPAQTPSGTPPQPAAPAPVNAPGVAGSIDEPVSAAGAAAAGETGERHEAAAAAGDAPENRVWLIVAVIVAAILILGGVWLFTKNRTAVPVAVAPAPVATPTAPAISTVVVPDVVGQSQSSAENAIKTLGLVPLVNLVTSTTKPAGTVIEQMPTSGTSLPVGSQVAIDVAQATAPPQPTSVSVPNVVGMSQADAQSALSAAGLAPAFVIEPSSVAKGTTIAQQPSAGVVVTPGTAVVVAVSSGTAPAPATVSIPNVVGMTQSAAITSLTNAKLSSQVIDTYSATVPKGSVAQQWPPAGNKVAPGTPVAVVVSMGPAPSGNSKVTVPNVVGMTVIDATNALAKVGLLSEQVSEPNGSAPEGTVVGQLPSAGSSVPAGDVILIGVAAPEPVQH